MTVYELLSDLFALLDLLENDVTLKQLMEASSKVFNLGDETVDYLLKSSNPTIAWVKREQNASALDELAKEVRKFSLGDTILKFNSLHSRLSSLISSIQQPTKATIDSLPLLLRQVIDRYERFIMNSTYENIYEFMKAIRTLNNAMSDIRHVLAAAYDIFFPRLEFKGNSELSIYFYWTKDYRLFINKLNSIDTLYSEVCPLFDVSKGAYPLRVVRAEFGSLWLRLFGESKVITLVTSLIESAVSYMHRNFTNEGKIEGIPKKLNAIEEILKLTEKLEAAGIDTQAVKENVQKSAIVVSKELNTLLMDEPSVIINGKKHSVGQDAEEKFLKEGVSLFLTEGDSTNEDIDK
jgi:hypothetical protein